MKCGTTKTDAGDLTVCGWADHGSLALAMFDNRSEAEAAPLMRQIRDAQTLRACCHEPWVSTPFPAAHGSLTGAGL